MLKVLLALKVKKMSRIRSQAGERAESQSLSCTTMARVRLQKPGKQLGMLTGAHSPSTERRGRSLRLTGPGAWSAW